MTLRELLAELLARVDQIESLKASREQAESDYRIVRQKLEEEKHRLATEIENGNAARTTIAADVERLIKEQAKDRAAAEKMAAELAELKAANDAEALRHDQLVASFESVKKRVMGIAS